MIAKRSTYIFIGLIISLLFAYLLVTRVDFDKVIEILGSVDINWILYAVLAHIIATLLWALRWKYILAPLRKISITNLYLAANIGQFGNIYLPAKIGEFARAFVLARREGLRKTSIMTSIILEKGFESVTILILISLSYPLLVPHLSFQKDSVLLKVIIGFFLFNILAIAILFLLASFRERTSNVVEKMLFFLPNHWLQAILSRAHLFYDGINIYTHKKEMVYAGIVSLAYWLVAALRIYFITVSFGLDFPLIGAILIQFTTLIALSVSAVPGHVGVHHAGSMAGLLLLGVDVNAAFSIAILLHAIPLAIITVLGLFSLWREHLRPFDLTNVIESDDMAHG